MIENKPPHPSSIKELKFFLKEHSTIKVQDSNNRKKISFKGFDTESSTFTFDDKNYNFHLKTENLYETGLTFSELGFIVERNGKKLIFIY